MLFVREMTDQELHSREHLAMNQFPPLENRAALALHIAGPFGPRLRMERERRRITLDSIAANTKIGVGLLKDLEQDNVSRWPSGIYRRSFIKAYAQAIGLDPEDVAREFLERFPDQAMLKMMFRGFPLFADMIRNVELGLAKCDLSIARLYAELVSDSGLRERMFGLISEEFERTRTAVLRITDQTELLENNLVLARSIRLRNPYVDPMSLIQVELLRRKRSGEDTPELNDALAATIHGISAGLRNTG